MNFANAKYSMICKIKCYQQLFFHYDSPSTNVAITYSGYHLVRFWTSTDISINYNRPENNTAAAYIGIW